MIWRAELTWRLENLRLPSLANSRMHWRRKASIARNQRALGFTSARVRLGPYRGMIKEAKKIIVTLTRYGRKKLDDDNLASSFKHVRDGIAQAIGIDDGSDIYRWCYDQVVGEYGVAVEIEFQG